MPRLISGGSLLPPTVPGEITAPLNPELLVFGSEGHGTVKGLVRAGQEDVDQVATGLDVPIVGQA